MSLKRSIPTLPLVLACLALAALGWVFVASRTFVDPRDKRATMPDPRGRSLVPEVSCVAPTRPARTGPSPRCVVSFGFALSAVGLAPGGTLAVVAITHAAATSWLLPASVAGILFEPLPAEAEARTILVDEARSQALFAVDSQLWRYDTSTGRVKVKFDGPGKTIEDLTWAREGSLIGLVADGKGFLLTDPGDGAQQQKIVRPLPTETRAAHVALDRTGTRAAVATETGEIAIFDLENNDPPRIVTPSLQPVAAIAFAGAHLLVAGSDGVLRALDPVSARESAKLDTGSPLVQLAVSADGRRAATADRDGVIRLHTVPDGAVTTVLSWHEANISALAFGAGSTLVSADNNGELAVWDLISDGRAQGEN